MTAPPLEVGAIAPLNANPPASLTDPPCLTVGGAPGTSSYQPTTVPPDPESTVCSVQIVSTPATGSVAALEPRFWERLVELAGRPDLRERAADGHRELEGLFASRPLAEWVELFDGEDVAVAPVRTLDEAGLTEPEGRPPALGEHTVAWRRELGLAAA